MPVPQVALTAEAAILPDPGQELRVEPLVAQDALVAQGQPVLRLRAHPSIVLVAPMAGRIAAIDLQPGRRLGQVVLFHDAGAGRHAVALSGATTAAALRETMQGAGLWRAFRRRPFGRIPDPSEQPAAIFVMAVDTRPDAPDPLTALAGREEDFARGLAALSGLTDKVVLCEPSGRPVPGDLPRGVSRLAIGALHPQGLAGVQIHAHRPVRIDAPVWDIHAEDVADLGSLLESGLLPQTRLVSVTGPALREPRLLRCQPGADLRGLVRPVVRPGPHELWSGCRLAGRPSFWLAPRDRQVTVQPQQGRGAAPHWFMAALGKSSRHRPIIPTAALDQAMGGGVPAAAFVRALAAGDAEALIRLGALSFLEEDLALADYVTGARPLLASQLRDMLARIEAEEGAP